MYPGPSVKHPLSREASLRLNVKDLELDPETESYFRDLVSANQNIRLSDLHPKTYEHFRLPKSESESMKWRSITDSIYNFMVICESSLIG